MKEKKLKFLLINLSILSVISCTRTINRSQYQPFPNTSSSSSSNTIVPVSTPTVKPTPAPSQKPTINSIKKTPVEEVYAPILLFDSEEEEPITSVEELLSMGVKIEAHKSFGKNPLLVKRATVNDLAKYPKLKQNIKGKDLTIMLQTDDEVADYDGKVYFHKFEKGVYTHLQYWFFYSYNSIEHMTKNKVIRQCGKHQGDWEHLSLRIFTEKLKIANSEKSYLDAIDSIYFSQHTAGQNDDLKYRKVKDPEVTFNGTQINAFVARGSHATYFTAHKDKGFLLNNILGNKLYDVADGKGKVLNSKGNLIDLEEEVWNKFGGKWGEVSNDVCNIAEWVSSASNDGPIGPYHKKVYKDTDWENN